MIGYLDHHAGAVQTLATIVLVLVTGWYALLTRNIARSAREAQRPYVFVDITSRGGALLEFMVGNAGDRATQQVALTLRHAGHPVLARDLAQLQPFTSGLAYLAPGRKYRYDIVVADQSVFDASRDPHVVVELDLVYRDADRCFSERVKIDVTAMSGVLISSFTEPGDAIAQQLAQLVSVERSRDSHNRMSRSMRNSAQKKCAACRSSISAVARKCPHCQEWQPATGLTQAEEPDEATDADSV